MTYKQGMGPAMYPYSKDYVVQDGDVMLFRFNV